MTDRGLGLAMIGATGIAAFILYMHDKVPIVIPGLPFRSAAPAAVAIPDAVYPRLTFPREAGPVYPITPFGSFAPEMSDSCGCGRLSWCGTVV